MSYYSCNNRNSCGCINSGISGAISCGCSNNNSCGGTASQQTDGYGCPTKPYFPFPPMGTVCGTCPPGTRPCPCNPYYWGGYHGCGTNNSGGTYAFFNSTGSTLTTGSVIPLRYVIGSGQLGKGTTGGVVNLDAGIYSFEYSLNAAADTAGAVITVTPEYLGALHPEYARSFTVSDAGQTFDIAGSFVANLPTDTALSLIVTITEPDATTTTTLTGANASMLVRLISGMCCNN